jgi:hypothetical protein
LLSFPKRLAVEDDERDEKHEPTDGPGNEQMRMRSREERQQRE